MKLLFVGTERSRAGVALHFLTLLRAMAAAGHRVEALADPDGFIAQGLADAGLICHPARFRSANSLAAHRTLARTIRSFEPDWLVTDFGKEFWPLIVHGRWHRTPVALFRHSARPMHSALEHALPLLSQRYLAVSEFARELYIRRGAPASKIQVLYNPIDTVAFSPNPEAGLALRDELGIPRDALVVGYVGRIHQDKGVDPLREALELAMETDPRLHAVWIGDGPAMDPLARHIRAGTHAHRHHFCGWRGDTPHCCNGMSVLAFPTLLQETFGRVSIEAQACGVPVLASRIGGVPETLQDGATGWLLPPGDVRAWRDALLAGCRGTNRAGMAIAARAFVERRFSMPRIAAAFTRLLVAAAARPSYRHPPSNLPTSTHPLHS